MESEIELVCAQSQVSGRPSPFEMQSMLGPTIQPNDSPSTHVYAQDRPKVNRRGMLRCNPLNEANRSFLEDGKARNA